VSCLCIDCKVENYDHMLDRITNILNTVTMTCRVGAYKTLAFVVSEIVVSSLQL